MRFFFSKIALGIKHEIDHLCAPGKSCHLENNLTGLDGSDLLPKLQSPALGNREGRAEGTPASVAKAWMAGGYHPHVPGGQVPPTTLSSLQIHAAAPGIRGWVQVLKSLPQVLGMHLGLAVCTGEPV
uniref:Uncharacterized protein n=1 Tax=Athene cunicularia TaxID=194338 RepID=A0A663NC54_ATHCN